ncbi:MAG: hypothetical protein HN396_04555 [Gemmatimonadales bacterium]|jgi:hypothetical protein|nr:hypothetical protein [Gemmatimonadales bacterium]
MAERWGNLAEQIREHCKEQDDVLLGFCVGAGSFCKGENYFGSTEDIANTLRGPEDIGRIDKAYDDGFGGADCPPVIVWTRDHVGVHDMYDGANGLRFVPRNPCDMEPEFIGGY